MRKRLFPRGVLASGVHPITQDQSHYYHRNDAVADDLLLVLFEQRYGMFDFKGELVSLKLFSGNS